MAEEVTDVAAEVPTEVSGEAPAVKEENGDEAGAEATGDAAEGVGEEGKEDVKEENKEPPVKPEKRLPQPNTEELQKKIEEQREIIRTAQSTLQRLWESSDKLKNAKKDGREETADLIKVRNEMFDEVKVKNEARKKIQDQIRDLRRLDSEAAKNSRNTDTPRMLKGLNTVADVERRIKELEYRQSTESMGVKEESAILKEITYLQHDGIDIIRKLEGQKSTAKADTEERGKKKEVLEAQRKVLDTEINEIQTRIDKQKKMIDDVRKVQQAQFDEIKDQTSDVDAEVEKKKKKDAYDEITRLKADHDKAYKEYKAVEAQWRAYDRWKKQQRFEKIKEEQRARRLEREKQLAELPEIDPYEEEKSMCNSLLTYMYELDPSLAPKGAEPKEAEPAAAAAQANGFPKSTGRRVVVEEGTTIGKTKPLGEEMQSKYDAFGKGKKSKRSRSAKPATDAEKRLQVHAIDKYTAFHKLGVKPPHTMSELPAAIEGVKKMQDYYNNAPPPKEDSEAQKTEKTKPKKAAASNAEGASEDAFPEPEGISQPTAALNAAGMPSRPSFIDIIRGKAAAPLEEFPAPGVAAGSSAMAEVAPEVLDEAEGEPIADLSQQVDEMTVDPSNE